MNRAECFTRSGHLMQYNVPMTIRTVLTSCVISLWLFGAIAYGQKPTRSPSPEDTGMTVINWVKNGVFVSSEGRFSIAIPELPKQTIDKATVKAKAKGVDVGKQYVWVIGRTLYTIYYNP